MRRELPAFKTPEFNRQSIDQAGDDASFIVMRRWNEIHSAMALLNFAEANHKIRVPGHEEIWNAVLDTASVRWGGPVDERERTKTVRSGELLTVRSNAALVLSIEPSGTTT